MAVFRGAVLECKLCGTAFKVPPSRAHKAEFCSLACAVVVRAERIKKRRILKCEHCEKPFEVRLCHVSRRKFCSDACREASPSYRAAMSARTAGAANAMWKGGITSHSDGYVYEHASSHPFASNGYVLQHRLVMERWLRESNPGSPFLIEIDGALYLSPAYLVHHKDEDKANNSIENLECLTPSEHQQEHARMRREARAAG